MHWYKGAQGGGGGRERGGYNTSFLRLHREGTTTTVNTHRVLLLSVPVNTALCPPKRYGDDIRASQHGLVSAEAVWGVVASTTAYVPLGLGADLVSSSPFTGKRFPSLCVYRTLSREDRDAERWC